MPGSAKQENRSVSRWRSGSRLSKQRAGSERSAHAKGDIAPRQRRDILQNRGREHDFFIQQVLADNEPCQVHVLEALGIGHIRIQLGVGGGWRRLEGRRPLQLQGTQHGDAAAQRTLLLAGFRTNPFGGLQRQAAGVVQRTARQVTVGA